MKIITMLSWYNEEFNLLRETIRGAAACGSTELVAVDGAYALYPNAAPRSKWGQVTWIDTLCQRDGMGLTLRRPSGPWEGNEVAKREAMLQLALTIADEGDWLMILDADHHVAECNIDVAAALSGTDLNVAEIGFYESVDATGKPMLYEISTFIRAIPGTHMGTNHYTYIFPNGTTSTILRAGGGTALRLDLRQGVVLKHAVYEQPPERRERQTAYYDDRDRLGVEK